MISKEELGKNIINYLIEKDIKVDDLAQQIGASKQSIYRWMNGKPMTNIYYAKLCKLMEECNLISKWFEGGFNNPQITNF